MSDMRVNYVFHLSLAHLLRKSREKNAKEEPHSLLSSTTEQFGGESQEHMQKSLTHSFLCLFKTSGGSVAGELCRSQYKGQFSWPKADLGRRQKTFNPTCQINNLFVVVRRKTPLFKRAKFVLANDHISLC